LGRDGRGLTAYGLTAFPVTLLTEHRENVSGGKSIDETTEESDDKSIIKNPGFESGIIGWETQNIIEGELYMGGISDTNNHTLSKVNIYSGKCAGRVILPGSKVWQNITGLKPDTEYVLTLFAKVRGEADELWAGIENHGGDSIHKVIKSMQYLKVQITFTTGKVNTGATIFLFKKEGRGEAWFDEFDIKES